MFKLGAHEILIGIGSNAPDALVQHRLARSALRAHPAFTLLNCSPLYSSDALVPPEAPPSWNIPYLNSACLLSSTITNAEDIIVELKMIEMQLGRIPGPRWSPRLIDLDLLAWGSANLKTESVQVPHPGLMERPFALLPALDCTGAQTHPWQFEHPENIPFHTRHAREYWPELVGILNITPDSFSDGRESFTAEELEKKIHALLDSGAQIIDIGAESTRPDATAISPEIELQRITPAIKILSEIKKRRKFQISLDSRQPNTVKKLLEKYPVDWINDVTGFANPELSALAAQSSCKTIVMHSLGIPPSRDKTLNPQADPIAELLAWGKSRIEELLNLGISPERIVIDPGIGFGKTAAQNLAILQRFKELNALKVPLLLGHSRKRFLDPENLVPAAERDLETAILSAHAVNSGADYLRVHSPSVQARALQLGTRLGLR